MELKKAAFYGLKVAQVGFNSHSLFWIAKESCLFKFSDPKKDHTMKSSNLQKTLSSFEYSNSMPVVRISKDVIKLSTSAKWQKTSFSPDQRRDALLQGKKLNLTSILTSALSKEEL